jgi:MraZ protein
VPAEFRKVLGDDGLVLYRSYKEEGVLEGVSMQRMVQLSDAIDKIDPFDTSQDDISTTIFADAHQLKFDLTGRITLPEHLVSHCELSDQAVFVGRGKTFQIWNPQRFAVYQEASRARINKLMQRSGE